MTDTLVVLCTCPDQAQAGRLADGLVENGFAACVNILPEIRSIYRWKGELNDDNEALMVIKTTRQAYTGLEDWIREHHPYDVPEVLAIPVDVGSRDYLDWVADKTKPGIGTDL